MRTVQTPLQMPAEFIIPCDWMRQRIPRFQQMWQEVPAINSSYMSEMVGVPPELREMLTTCIEKSELREHRARIRRQHEGGLFGGFYVPRQTRKQGEYGFERTYYSPTVSASAIAWTPERLRVRRDAHHEQPKRARILVLDDQQLPRAHRPLRGAARDGSSRGSTGRMEPFSAAHREDGHGQWSRTL